MIDQIVPGKTGPRSKLLDMGILASDTSPEAERVQMQIFRSMPPARKAALLSGAVRAGFTLGRKDMTDPFDITWTVVEALDKLGIEYFVGGSVASTLHGEPRFTQDTDLIVRIEREQIEPLKLAVEEQFYISPPALLEAIQRKSSSYLVHFESGYKVDLMISRERAFELSRFQRKVKLTAAGHEFWVSSAEDIVLAKLEWYRLGREISDHQWRDVLTVMLTNNLDQLYLNHWAQELKVQDLLEKARHVLGCEGAG